MCEILMLIFGIIALVRGRFLLTRAKEVRGWPARIIGVLLIMPFPLSFLVGMVLGGVFVAMGKSVDDQEFRSAASILGFAIVAICFLSAIGIAMFLAEPIRKNRPGQEDLAIPADYDERFQVRPLDSSKSQDITGGPSRLPTNPDDRIQP